MTRETDSTVITLPLWQVVLVLIGLPVIYMANSLMPWSIGLLRSHDHSFFFEFWMSIAILHWGSVLLVIMLLKRIGGRLDNIGVHVSPIRVAVMVGIPVLVGLALTVLHQLSGVNQVARSDPSALVAPATTVERLFWIFISFTAGFCEELIYRGFYISVLRGLNMPIWSAVGLATLAFVFMHGANVLQVSPAVTIYIMGLLFCALFLWRRTLVPGICLHALIDLAAIGLPIKP